MKCCADVVDLAFAPAVRHLEAVEFGSHSRVADELRVLAAKTRTHQDRGWR